MVDTPEIFRTEAQTAVIRLKIPRDQIKSVMEPAIDELMGAVSDQCLKLLGRSMRDEGLEPGETVWESYVRGPESGPDRNTWRTELNLPLGEIGP